MRSDKNLDKRAKEVIVSIIERMGEVTVDEVIEIIEPHFKFDLQTARDKEMRRKAQQIMSSIRDGNGQRTCYSDNAGTYINLDTTTNLPALRKTKGQIEHKYAGLRKALRKARKREQILEGQISLFESEGQ